jgi:hypothetical protein
MVPIIPKLLPNFIVMVCAESVAESISFSLAEGEMDHFQLNAFFSAVLLACAEQQDSATTSELSEPLLNLFFRLCLLCAECNAFCKVESTADFIDFSNIFS